MCRRKVQAANGGVCRRIVLVVQVRLARKIALELYPVELLNLFLFVGLDEAVQLAISDTVEDPSVSAQVARGLRQLDLYCWIVVRYDDIEFYLAFRAFGLGGDAGDEHGRDRDSSN